MQLSITQNLKLNGAIVVSTPQQVALLDARRAIEMFNKVNVQILGLVQNMSSFKCSNCGHEEHIFGRNGTDKLAHEIGCQLLGDVPLVTAIQEKSDCGEPISIHQQANNEPALQYKLIAQKIISQLKLVV